MSITNYTIAVCTTCDTTDLACLMVHNQCTTCQGKAWHNLLPKQHITAYPAPERNAIVQQQKQIRAQRWRVYLLTQAAPNNNN